MRRRVSFHRCGGNQTDKKVTVQLEDYSKTEKISDLPKKLTREGASAGAEPSVGDIAYYAPWGNLALFYKNFRYSDGLILLQALTIPPARELMFTGSPLVGRGYLSWHPLACLPHFSTWPPITCRPNSRWGLREADHPPVTAS
jgi:hypothetical protein